MASKKKSVAAPAESETSFEESMTQLAQIVEALEGDELSLEDSLARFEEGVSLARRAQERLDRAEARVEELLGYDDDGEPQLEEL